MCESIEGIENNFCANRNISAELLFRSLFDDPPLSRWLCLFGGVVNKIDSVGLHIYTMF